LRITTLSDSKGVNAPNPSSPSGKCPLVIGFPGVLDKVSKGLVSKGYKPHTSSSFFFLSYSSSLSSSSFFLISSSSQLSLSSSTFLLLSSSIY
jgi:hypothetical protein